MDKSNPGMDRLRGRVALITGAARPRGIGYAMGRLFAKEGCSVIITDIADQVLERADELRAEGYSAVGFKADLTNFGETKEMVDKAIDQLGRIDILCNAVGGSLPPRPNFLELSEEYWNTVMDRNLRTVFNCCKAVISYMVEQEYGKIVNISSITGTKVVYRYSTAYAASKGAVSAFTKALALEMGEHNITVNTIIPGDIDTADREWTPQRGPRNLGDLTPHLTPPVSRPGRPEEVADLALFLATDDSRFITGTEIVIDGGATIVEPLPTPP
ncbi:MAG: SDR family oxidoreductase [Deltaproteobacteria bacterium]|nr:SDR family oxidoreductase [Deltaproteobacteria bacterium]